MKLTADQVKAKIRERHKLSDDAPVEVKTLPIAVKMDADESHKFTARISTSSIDRDSEVVIPAGMDATDFEKMGTIFWNHNYDQPVGYAGSLKRDKDGIDAIGNTFMARPDDYSGDFFPDFARAFVSQAVKAGKQPGVSIGFMPTESRPPSKKDIEVFGPNVRRVISKWKLLEFSIAPVQANQDAVVTAIGKSLGNDAVKALGLEIPREKRVVMVPMTPEIRNFRPRQRPKRKQVDIAAIVREEVALQVKKLRGDIYG